MLSQQVLHACGNTRRAPKPDTLGKQHPAPILLADPGTSCCVCRTAGMKTQVFRRRSLKCETFVPRDRKGEVPEEEPDEKTAGDKASKCSGRDEPGAVAQASWIKKSGGEWTERAWQTSHAPAFQSCAGAALPRASLPGTRGFRLLGRALCVFLFFLFCSWVSKTRARLLPAWPSVSVSYGLGAVDGRCRLALISLCFSSACCEPLPRGSARGLCPRKPQSMALPAPLPQGQCGTVTQPRNGPYKKKQDVGGFTFQGGVSVSLGNAGGLQRELFKFWHVCSGTVAAERSLAHLPSCARHELSRLAARQALSLGAGLGSDEAPTRSAAILSRTPHLA